MFTLTGWPEAMSGKDREEQFKVLMTHILQKSRHQAHLTHTAHRGCSPAMGPKSKETVSPHRWRGLSRD